MKRLKSFQDTPEVCVSKGGQVPTHYHTSSQAGLWRVWSAVAKSDLLPNSASSRVRKDQGNWPQKTSLAFPQDCLRKRIQHPLGGFSLGLCWSVPVQCCMHVCACAYVCEVLVCVHVHICVWVSVCTCTDRQEISGMCAQAYMFVCVWAPMAALIVHMYEYMWVFMRSHKGGWAFMQSMESIWQPCCQFQLIATFSLAFMVQKNQSQHLKIRFHIKIYMFSFFWKMRRQFWALFLKGIDQLWPIGFGLPSRGVMWPPVCQSPYHSLFLTHLCYLLGPYKNLNYWIKFQWFSSKPYFCLQCVSSLQPGQFPNPGLHSPSATLPMWSFCPSPCFWCYLPCLLCPPHPLAQVESDSSLSSTSDVPSPLRGLLWSPQASVTAPLFSLAGCASLLIGLLAGVCEEVIILCTGIRSPPRKRDILVW